MSGKQPQPNAVVRDHFQIGSNMGVSGFNEAAKFRGAMVCSHRLVVAHDRVGALQYSLKQQSLTVRAVRQMDLKWWNQKLEWKELGSTPPSLSAGARLPPIVV